MSFCLLSLSLVGEGSRCFSGARGCPPSTKVCMWGDWWKFKGPLSVPSLHAQLPFHSRIQGLPLPAWWETLCEGVQGRTQRSP